MTRGQFRSLLYRAGRVMGDEAAVEKTIRTGKASYVGKRLERRVLGRAAGQVIRRITR